MQFITDLFITLLAGYLACTNYLADQLLTLFPDLQPTAYEYVDNASVSPANIPLRHISAFPSDYATDHIPDVLIQNASYQHASSVAGINTFATSTHSVAEALVNILCTYTTDTYTRTTTGTGFFINPEGVILTNAHVAQFLLLETVSDTGETSCIVRIGDPATPQYEAELLYISPAWIQKNAHLIANEMPKGTGERDYALLFVTAGIANKPMPSRFPHLRIATEVLTPKHIGDAITVGGYPAAAFFTEGPATLLSPKTATTSITDLYTFGSTYADLIAVSGSTVGERGTSGGPVLNAHTEVIGLITTKGDDETNGAGSLRALTLSYIDRTIIEESTFSLEETITGNLAFRAQLFKETIVPFLSRMLSAELSAH